MKTAYELAMEKLRRRDAERGETETPLDDARKQEIAGIRQVYTARLAEREILHKAELRKARASGDAEAVRALEEAQRAERGRIEAEMESKIQAVRQRAAGAKG